VVAGLAIGAATGGTGAVVGFKAYALAFAGGAVTTAVGDASQQGVEVLLGQKSDFNVGQLFFTSAIGGSLGLMSFAVTHGVAGAVRSLGMQSRASSVVSQAQLNEGGEFLQMFLGEGATKALKQGGIQAQKLSGKGKWVSGKLAYQQKQQQKKLKDMFLDDQNALDFTEQHPFDEASSYNSQMSLHSN